MRPLYEIPTDFQRAIAAYQGTLRQLEEDLEAGDIDTERAEQLATDAEDLLRTQLDALDAQFATKADACYSAVRNAEQEAEVETAKAAPFQAEAERHLKRARRAERSANWLKSYILHQMLRQQLQRVECPSFLLRWQRNGRPRIVSTDLDSIPAEHLVPQPPKLNQVTLMALFKSNKESLQPVAGGVEDVLRVPGVPGVEFYLGKHLRSS